MALLARRPVTPPPERPVLPEKSQEIPVDGWTLQHGKLNLISWQKSFAREK